MRRALFALLIVLPLAVAPATASEDALRTYRFTDLEGREFTLADHAGQVVVVNFWASWCKPCRTELPELDAWQREMGDVEFVAVSVDRDAAKAQRLVATEEIGMTVVIDGPDGLARDLDLAYLPCTVVLGPDGSTQLVTPGVTPEKMSELHRTIQALRPATTTAGLEVGR